MFYVVLLFMVAAFLALRLYSVLGKRTGHEQPLPRAGDARLPATVPARPAEVSAEPREPVRSDIAGGAEHGLRAIVSAEPGFDVAQFVGGAKSAYRMVLEAFWRGDTDALAWLVEDDVRAAFAEAIAARESGHRLENRLVAIERATILGAGVAGRRATISVAFEADVAAVTRDAEGQVIGGSLTDALSTHEVWTFARELKSADPNWKLADTDEA